MPYIMPITKEEEKKKKKKEEEEEEKKKEEEKEEEEEEEEEEEKKKKKKKKTKKNTQPHSGHLLTFLCIPVPHPRSLSPCSTITDLPFHLSFLIPSR
jgi:chromatin remodeling complex protein RSC6